MRKYISALPIIVLPYVLVFFLYCVATGFLIETVFDNFILFPLLILILIYTGTVIYSFMIGFYNIRSKKDYMEILTMNMIIKLLHVPAYIIVFILGAAFFITIMFVISFLFLFLDVVTILCTGLIGATGVFNAYKEDRLTQNEAIIYGVFQFIFCIDVFSSVYLFKKMKKNL